MCATFLLLCNNVAAGNKYIMIKLQSLSKTMGSISVCERTINFVAFFSVFTSCESLRDATKSKDENSKTIKCNKFGVNLHFLLSKPDHYSVGDFGLLRRCAEVEMIEHVIQYTDCTSSINMSWECNLNCNIFLRLLSFMYFSGFLAEGICRF